MSLLKMFIQLGSDVSALRAETLRALKMCIYDENGKNGTKNNFASELLAVAGPSLARDYQQTAIGFVQIFDRACPNLKGYQNLKRNLCLEVLEYN